MDVVSGGEISVGDEVEYILIQSRPNSKPFATNVRKIRLADSCIQYGDANSCYSFLILLYHTRRF